MKRRCFDNKGAVIGTVAFLITFLIAAITQGATLKVGTHELRALLDQGVPVIDVRTPEEWRTTGVIPGSHLLTFFDRRGNYDLDDWLNKLTQITALNEPLVIICEVGNRSQVISNFLSTRLGYHRVYDAFRGMQEWVSLAMPVHPWP